MNPLKEFLHRVTQGIERTGFVSLCFIMVIISSMTIVSCNTSKANYKRGVKLQEQGLNQEAADAYYAALQRNRSNVDAKIGLKNTGQQVLNKKLEEFTKYKLLGDKKTAVYRYVRAMEYHKRIEKIGVTLDIPPYYTSDYEEVTQSYLSDLYDEGITLMDEGRFEEAKKKFKEIGKFDSNYKDANNLEDIAYLEPLYKQGLAEYELEHYRSAYSNFQKVVERDPDFKEAKQLRESCLENGLFTMALLKFENSTSQSGLQHKISAYALDALTSIEDPFLKVVDRENMELIINEQQLGLSGVIDEETAVNVGNLTGAQAIITGTVLSHSVSPGKLQKFTMKGYESYRVKRTNPDTRKTYYETRYRSTYYYKYQKKNTATVSFQYKVISLETGEVLDSKIIDKTLEDAIVYAEYGGDPSNLWPERNGQVDTNRSKKRELENLIHGRKDITHPDELSNDLMKDVSGVLSTNIETLMNQLIK